MQTNNNTDTSHTTECWLGSHLNPHVALMTLEQFLEHLAERNGVVVFASGPETPFYPVDPAQLTDDVWETMDTVRIGPAFVLGSEAHKEEST